MRGAVRYLRGLNRRASVRIIAWMNPFGRIGCRAEMKALGALALLALVLCGSALAKFKITIAASDTMPAAGQRVTLVVRSEQALDHDLRLIAVAPGQPLFRVVATITGDTSRPVPNVARHGFEIHLTRVAPNRWRGTARFHRNGRWRVVVPNWGPVGVVVPNGAALLALRVH
jgi:uncharacterized cupredoxin-like copper-binding protein